MKKTTIGILPIMQLVPGYPCSVPGYPWSVHGNPGSVPACPESVPECPPFHLVSRFISNTLKSFNQLNVLGTIIWYIFQK